MEEEDMLDDEMTILTAREAAEYLWVSLFTLKRIETEGWLRPYHTPGGHRRYSVRMLDEYLETSRTSSHRPELESESEVE
jgi:excisionase family DNA binding protein